MEDNMADNNRTLTDEIITIIEAHSNNNPAPETVTITRVYSDGYVDAVTDKGTHHYIQTIGATTVNSIGVLLYPNGETSKPLIISLGDYYTRTELTSLLAGKQDKLVSGTNIKTINNQTLLGSGNITIQGGGGGTVNMVGAFTINDSGHLIVELPDGYSNPYSINSSGHLIYDTSATEET